VIKQKIDECAKYLFINMQYVCVWYTLL